MAHARLADIGGYCVSNGVPRRSMVVAAVIGTVINLINQGDVLLSGGDLNWLKIGLSYVLPYCVATYGAVSVQMKMSRR